MLKKQLLLPPLFCFGMALVSGPVSALGFRASSPSAALGQPLDFNVALSVDAGESLASECVRAEVTVGDRVLPKQAVNTTIDGLNSPSPKVRVQTLVRIDEPVVAIEVSAGCAAKVVRRFVVFADPPLVMAPAPVVVSPPVVAAAPKSAPASAPSPRAVRDEAGASTTDTAPARPSPPRVAAAPPAKAAPAPRSAAKVPAASKAPAPKARDLARAEPRASARPPTKPVEAAPPSQARLRLDGGVSTARLGTDPGPLDPAMTPLARLRLDAADPFVGPNLSVQALVAVEEATLAVMQAMEAASAARRQIATLEDSVERLRREAAAQAGLTAKLQQQVDAAQAGGRWFWPLIAALGALLVLLAWTWTRLRAAESGRQQAWHEAAAPPPAEAVVATEALPTAAPEPAPAPGAALDAFTELPTDLRDVPALQTQPLVAATPSPAAHKGVSAEELIDLEQQAEFFVVLGQDDAAIDLLVGHLRETGGASPLPYLKLLDIYRRLGDQAAYERTRDRFNHRFNATAPDWDAPPLEGQTLADYPEVMEWIEQVWPTPIDAMAELESLLFRRADGELFDLPAYRELLFLYALARDLTTQSGDSAGGAIPPIDVLLPMSERPQAASHVTDGGADEPTAWAVADVNDPATAPVDLDLTEPTDSAFDKPR